MRLVRNILIFLIALYVGIIIFMPKSELYFYAEKELKKQGVVIDNEVLEPKIASLTIQHPVVYYQGVDVLRVAKLKITPLLFVNTIEADSIELLNVAKQFLNIDIDKLKLNHTILKPFRVKLWAVGSFGEADGFINLKQRVIHIDISKIKNINPIKRFLKKGAKGWYYESRF